MNEMMRRIGEMNEMNNPTLVIVSSKWHCSFLHDAEQTSCLFYKLTKR
ncbi:hypothetical protein KFU94_20350 [Chloroflexi bacterium TSY]|nr:hypothetical protein [Chloroflexi bacterium TSY]